MYCDIPANQKDDPLKTKYREKVGSLARAALSTPSAQARLAANLFVYWRVEPEIQIFYAAGTDLSHNQPGQLAPTLAQDQRCRS